jgi:phosphoglycerate dehydrogenase-like enzyme
VHTEEGAIVPPDRIKLLIATWLEEEQVARIRAFAPDRVEVLHEPALLPRPRYIADHHGIKPALDAAGRARWAALRAEAEIAFDFDWAEPQRLPESAPKLRWVQGTSAGIGEFLERTGLARSSIRFTTAAGVHARPLAEFALLGLLYFVREVPMLRRRLAERLWERFTSRSLDGMRVLVVGLGGVGRAVAAALPPFGIEVWGNSRTTPAQPVPGLTRFVPTAELRDALGRIDALVLACPLTKETEGMIGRAEIDRLRPGAILVNIARGQVIDEPALIEALAAGRLGGAALDVFATEPLPRESPLWGMENVLVAPHSASTVAQENQRIVDLFLDNLGRYLEGRPLRNLFEPSRGY